jgi:opacity protein-like surface antigen
MKKIARFASSLLCLAFYAAAGQTAAAAERGFYVGGHAGQSSKDAPRSFYDLFNDDIQSFAFFAPTQQRAAFDDSDIAFGLVMGYRLTTHLAFEGGYNNFGQVNYTSRSSGTFPLEAGELDVNIETETTGFTVAALGLLPLSRDWELFARAGALFADNKIAITVNGRGNRFVPPLGNRFSGSDSEGSTNLYAGVGLSRRVFELYALRLEYQRAFDAGTESTGGKGDLDAALLSLIVTF